MYRFWAIVMAVLFAGGLGCRPKDSSTEKKPTDFPNHTRQITRTQEVYKSIGETALTLEIDRPSGDEPHPVIIYVHSWSGTAGQLKKHSERMAKNLGVAGVRINYRKMSEGHTFAQAMSDLEAAIGFVRENAQRYGFDLNRMGLAGASAGAVLSSVAAQQTPECRVYIAFNGGFDLINTGESNFLRQDRLEEIMGGLSREHLEAGSAICQIKQPPPVTLLLHGTEDEVIDPDQAVRFAGAIQKMGGTAEVKLLEGQGHGFFNYSKPSYEEVVHTMEEFLRRHL